MHSWICNKVLLLPAQHYDPLALKLEFPPRRGDQGARSLAQRCQSLAQHHPFKWFTSPLLILHLVCSLEYFAILSASNQVCSFFFLTILNVLLYLMPWVDLGLLLVVLNALTTFNPLSLFNYYNSCKVVSIVQSASRFNLVEMQNVFG